MTMENTVETVAVPDAPAGPTPPRTRWAAVIWGAFFAAVAAIGLWLLADPVRRAAVTDGVTSLTPGTVVAAALLSIGVLVLVAGATGLIRRAQRRFAERATPE